MARTNAQPDVQWSGHRKTVQRRRRRRDVVIVTAVVAVIAAASALVVALISHGPPNNTDQTIPYLGIYEPDAPTSYAGIDHVAQLIGRQPDLAVYYSYWGEPFDAKFAEQAARHGATTLVQISPETYPLATIAAGNYDGYLSSFAAAVKAFHIPVVLSFGHEMNGAWYPWARKHTPAAVFVQAWRHIVTVFRQAGATNVTWLWTTNIKGTSTPGARPWWPGQAYVDWVGIDGYFWYSAADFYTVFGPSIAYIRQFTQDPILIGETGASTAHDQPAKIADLFAGVRGLGLLGFVWNDDRVVSAAIKGEVLDWRLSQQSLAVLKRDASKFVEVHPSPPAHSRKTG